MAFLLDTHTLLWFYAGEEKLPSNIRLMIENIDNECYVSICSLWEMVIKINIGKLTIDGGLKQLVAFLESNRIELLSIDLSHLMYLGNLPTYHNDPFDRMIISQAQAEQLTIIGLDDAFKKYDVPVLWK